MISARVTQKEMAVTPEATAVSIQRRMSSGEGTRPLWKPVLTGPPWNSAAHTGAPRGLQERM